MQHIKLKGNDNKIIQAKSYERLLTIMCIWNDGRQVTSSKNDKTHPAKNEQEKKSPLSKKDKKFKKNKEEKTGGFLVMHISLASKKIPSSSAPSLSAKSSFCFFERGPRIKNGKDGAERKYKSKQAFKKCFKDRKNSH